MRIMTGLIWLLLPIGAGCSQHEATIPSNTHSEERVTAWQKDWSDRIGKIVILEGTAANAKLGALLLGEGTEIWIDGLQQWPDGFYIGCDHGKRVRVTGTVIKRDDLPTSVLRPGEPVKQGTWGGGTEEDVEKAKRRFLLKDASWTVLD